MAKYKNKSNINIGLERQEAEKVLRAFLHEKSEVKVLAIKGDWGIGKTHLVREFLANNIKRYYYGSVFGISSIDELKIKLLSNLQAINKEENNFLSKVSLGRIINSIKESSKAIEKLIEKIPVIGEIGSTMSSSGVSLIGSIVINKLFENQLICIDDIERKSKKLQLDELLGFVESLVAEQKCKVILIYYEDKLNEDIRAKKTLKEYREKVIDIEIKLSPSAAENFYIGFGRNYPDEEFIFDYLRKESIQTNNIRVLKKLRWVLEQLRPYTRDFLPIVRHQIIKEITFISLAKFDKKFPVNLDELLSLGDYPKILANKVNEDENLYLTALSLGYSGSSISDEIVCLVETSICNYDKFFEAGKQLNDAEKSKKVRERLSEAYAPYSESFSSSEEDLCKNLKEFLNNYLFFIDLHQLQQIEAISQAIELDLIKYKRDWLKYQVDNLNTFESLKSIEPLLRDFPILTPVLKEKINSLKKKMSINEVLVNALRNRSWSLEEADYLNAHTVEDYKQWLLTRDSDQYYMVKQGLSMEISNLRQAIIELAQESSLNFMRAKNLYNIDISKMTD